jgi:hypothetical protein
VASSGGATFVAVMQAAHLGERHDLAGAGWLDRPSVRRVLAEREVRARALVQVDNPTPIIGDIVSTSLSIFGFRYERLVPLVWSVSRCQKCGKELTDP